MKRKVVSLTGSSSVGKTTVFERMKKKNLPFYFLGEVARKVKSLGIPINEQGTAVTQRLIAASHLVNLSHPGNLILDRSLVDCLAYTEVLVKHKPEDNFLKQTLEDIYQLFDYFYSEVTHYVYFPIEFDLVKDGVRLENETWRREVDIVMRQIFEDYKISYLTVTGLPEKREEQILNYIKS